MTTNQLIHETSPYLQQHAHNPVQWYPWGPEALSKARQENKPILLSIGYAACHWCHVMAHESFEDTETANLMNNLYVNIKVDKEERADLDKIYQTTHYLLTQQSGGWPLTVFLEPHDLIPFFSGTYFPLEDRYQLPAFKKILRYLAEVYQNKQNEIKIQNAELLKILNPPPPDIADVRLNQQPIENAKQNLQRQFDVKNGGFGHAPKFPQPTRLAFLLETSGVPAEESARSVGTAVETSLSSLVIQTLVKMAQGGIYDQLGGGFFRYSVDAEWRIPHFEKMLYDNAQLLFLYAQASHKTNYSLFADVVHATANWIMTDMQAPEGGYYASMDADSEGHEGKYYVWDKHEITQLLPRNTLALFEPLYGLNQSPNFENHWHLYIAKPAEIADNHLLAVKQILLTARKKRIPPAIDHKILTGWNALMIKAMLTAGHLFKEKKYIDSAERALAFIKQNYWANQHLLATSKHAGYLDDYAFLIEALLVSYQISAQQDHLDFAIALSEALLQRFADPVSGGFYFTANDQETLFYRPKIVMDEATPAGNAVAAQCLFTLGQLLHEPRYTRAAITTLHAAWPLLTHHPDQHCGLLQALELYFH